ncbi:MAG: polymorphic toxin-type HINT domain-containing protein [Aureliella sp.]
MPSIFRLRSTLSYWLVLSSVVFSGWIGSAREPSPPESLRRTEFKVQDKVARSLIGQALKAEVEGDVLARERYLNEARIAQPNSSAHHWYQGRLLGLDGSWVSVDEAIELSKTQPLFDEYRAFRATQPANVVGQWNVAVWCAKHGLPMQCRAHLSNILMRDPEHKPARLALGHQLIQGEWMSPEEIGGLVSDAEKARIAFAKYGDSIDRLLKVASNKSYFGRAAARKQLFAIHDPLVVPVLESAAQTQDEKLVLMVVEILARLECQPSTLVLAKLATFSPSSVVRKEAIVTLKRRSFHDFVPQLLEAMSSPIAFSSIPVFKANGELKGFQQAFGKEKMGEKRVWRFDTSLDKFRYRRRFFSGIPVQQRIPVEVIASSGPVRLTAVVDGYVPFMVDPAAFAEEAFCSEVAKLAATADSHSRLANAMDESRRIEQTNSQIGEVLTAVSGERFISLPSDAWNWWDQLNETDYQSDKLVRRRYETARYVSDGRNTPEVFNVELLKIVRLGSCFVAGTPVTTSRGLVPIEKIEAGDQVLSRSVRTGELCFMPVVAATKRKPARTVILKVNDEVIRATTSHLLWVSGKGWTKAGDIRPGDLLHSAAEPAVVMKTTPSQVLPTHNLVVDDFHTYFVGKSRVLSHDVLPRIQAHEAVPGEFVFVDAD